MADPRDIGGAPEIPDLDLPAPRSGPGGSGRPAVRSTSLPVKAPQAPVAIHEAADDFGMEIERGNVSAPPAAAHSLSGKPLAIDVAGSDDFEMEIERGGALVSAPPAVSARPPLTTSGRPAGDSRASGLEITYRRRDAGPRADADVVPPVGQRIGGILLTGVACLGTAALLARVAHQEGGRSLTGAIPHAFDATSTTQSGAVAVAALVLGIGLGFAGLKLSPRSYAMIGSAAMLLIASLAMVTVTLVATDEHPTPPDGALLIPYVVPLGIFLLGIGVAGRGLPLFQQGGARRAATVLAGGLGGALLFAAAEMSILARLL